MQSLGSLRALAQLGGVAAAGVGPVSGALSAARVRPDGWTVELDFLGLSVGTADPTKLTVSAAPPAADYLGVSMSGVSTRNISGATSNLNPVYDVDFPFPAQAAAAGVLTVPVRLAAPVRSGETIGVTVTAGLMTGSLSGAVLAVNNSNLRVVRYAQDQYGADPAKLLAAVDFWPGCRTPVGSLLPVASLPASFGSGQLGGKYDHCRYDSVGKRVFVGNGAGDLSSPVLADVDFTTTPDVYITFNSPNAKARDIRFGSRTLNQVVLGVGPTNSTIFMHWFECAGDAKAHILGGGTMTGQWSSALENGNTTTNTKFDIGYGYIHATAGDLHHIPKGDVHHNLMEDNGWDNRASQSHADGLIGVPNVAAVRSFYNFVDQSMGASGGFAYASAVSISGTTITLTLTGSNPTLGFAPGIYACVAGINPAAYSGQKLVTAVTSNTISYSVASNIGAPSRVGSAYIAIRSLSGYYGLDNPTGAFSGGIYAGVYPTIADATAQKSDGFEAFGDLVISNDVSAAITNTYARGGTGDSLANPSPDNRYNRGVNLHDIWVTKPTAALTPLYQQDKSKPYTLWPPDSKYYNCRNPLDNTVWTMGPQPADTEYFMTVDSPTHAAGDTVVYTLRIDYYLAQYGAETITISQSGAGFTNSLATDMAAAISGITGLSFSGGVLTISPGATGNRKGQSNQGLYVTISRPTNVGASGAHSLTLSGLTAGHGAISAASASTTLS